MGSPTFECRSRRYLANSVFALDGPMTRISPASVTTFTTCAKTPRQARHGRCRSNWLCRVGRCGCRTILSSPDNPMWKIRACEWSIQTIEWKCVSIFESSTMIGGRLFCYRNCRFADSMTFEISAMLGLVSRPGSVSQKGACRAFLKKVVRYPSKYPFA